MAYRNDLSQLKNQATYNNDLMSLVFENMTDEELKLQYPPQPIHPNAIDITGQRFGKLTALWKVGNKRQGHSSTQIFAFRCDCGKIKFSTSQMARTNQITSCGCGAQDRGKQKQLNLLNKKFGRLTVIKQLPSEDRAAHWLCQCECGNQCKRSSHELNRSGGSISCGICIQYDSIRQKLIEKHDIRNQEILSKPINTLVGLHFGKLLIIEEMQEVKNTYKIFKALCDCGNICEVTIQALRKGKTSCGCDTYEKYRESKTTIHPGDRFGRLTALECIRIPGDTHLRWKCKCDCGSITDYIRSTSLTSGETMSCGCLNSKGEEKIAQILNENFIVFNRQQKYPDLLSPKGAQLKYDFLINNEFLLEYDGIQHFEEDDRSDNTLEERKLYDSIKDEYAKSHNIPLKRIPYWDFDKITLENIMSDKWLI